MSFNDQGRRSMGVVGNDDEQVLPPNNALQGTVTSGLRPPAPAHERERPAVGCIVISKGQRYKAKTDISVTAMTSWAALSLVATTAYWAPEKCSPSRMTHPNQQQRYIAYRPTIGGCTESSFPFETACSSGSTAAFFLTLAFFSLVLFRKRDMTRAPTPRKVLRNRVYAVCGYTILGCIAFIAVVSSLSPASPVQRLDPVFWLEAIAIWAFGWSWFTKGEGILKDCET